MLRSFKVIGKFLVIDKFGVEHEPEFYQKIHYNVKNFKKAWQDAIEEVIEKSERNFGSKCSV